MKIVVLILVSVFSVTAWSKTAARVAEINGSAFLFYGKGKSVELHYGDKIPDLSEVMVEDTSTLSLVDSYGTLYHLSGGTLTKFFNHMMELKNGNIWVESKEGDHSNYVSTVNSMAKYGKGQFIYSFDNMTGKTQILVITGDVQFSNALEPELNLTVPSGHFSLVDKEYEKGLPRSPTRVGLHSYKQLKTFFTGIDLLKNKKLEKMFSPSNKRVIASVPGDTHVRKVEEVYTGKKGKLLIIRSQMKGTREPASAMKYYEKVKHKQQILRRPQKTGKSAPMRFFGKKLKPAAPAPQAKVYVAPKKVNRVATVPVVKKEVKRVPASIAPAPKDSSDNLVQDLNTSFEQSLNDSINQNKKHPKEVNQLIDELKSYNQEYSKQY